MVVFTCNHCGEAIQKPKVEKHYGTVCRRPKDLTCVDCLKDFRAEEYAIHTNCLTEDQRYSAKGTELKPLKGMQKQDNWIEIVQTCYDTEPGCKIPKHEAVFKAILGQTNIPRKKVKFLNFLTLSAGNRINKTDAADVFDLIQNYYVKQQALKKSDSANKDDENSKKIEDNDKKLDNLSENKEDEGKNKKKSKIDGNQESASMQSTEIVENFKNKNKKKKKRSIDTVEAVEESGTSKKRRIVASNIVEESKKPKSENDENTMAVVKKTKKNKTTEIAAITIESNSPTKKKSKNKQQNGVSDIPQKQDDILDPTVIETSVVKKGKKKKNNENGLFDTSGSQNGVDKVEVPEIDVSEGIISKSKKKRQKNREKVLKKANETVE